MELVSYSSATSTLPREKLVAGCCSFSKLLTIPDYHRTLLPPYTKSFSRDTQPHFEASNRTQKFVVLSKRQQLWVSEQENGSEEEEEASSYSDDESSFLSLSMKPDRNMALLDDYEMEELDYTDPNHRSG